MPPVMSEIRGALQAMEVLLAGVEDVAFTRDPDPEVYRPYWCMLPTQSVEQLREYLTQALQACGTDTQSTPSQGATRSAVALPRPERMTP